MCCLIAAGGEARIAAVGFILLGSLACFGAGIAVNIFISSRAHALIDIAINKGIAAFARASGAVRLACIAINSLVFIC